LVVLIWEDGLKKIYRILPHGKRFEEIKLEITKHYL